MSTYKQIQEYVKNNYGYKPKSSWIAHCKEVYGLPIQKAKNRQDTTKRKNPCPIHKQNDIKNSFLNYGML